ncbi:hypothetical protein OK116_09035 [Xylella fastidiosa subsp. fastidiosa]|jgi:hypothetical protein|nr:hypothetical protein [Xylella fastidiosa]ADN62498.1 hypothetical protein XFLM_02495 [Xylella fastidiosa subsp. fastidiosa GB514]KAF0571131.1 hypothetical protein P305_06380 [Xylella fastidiosa subsp. fastidiosa Mus-1]MBE0264788.1 hypothetical protein [Xylella fastidiosa subsp. fastidiosa]MBE0266934.1 hypothetical protein [Xylella fastidiosa subsp. fastidiosa]MBE0271386.1 hypothetical protein [Xylella fastidiosa subsp. fastidiosa]
MRKLAVSGWFAGLMMSQGKDKKTTNALMCSLPWEVPLSVAPIVWSKTDKDAAYVV